MIIQSAPCKSNPKRKRGLVWISALYSCSLLTVWYFLKTTLHWIPKNLIQSSQTGLGPIQQLIPSLSQVRVRLVDSCNSSLSWRAKGPWIWLEMLAQTHLNFFNRSNQTHGIGRSGQKWEPLTSAYYYSFEGWFWGKYLWWWERLPDSTSRNLRWVDFLWGTAIKKAHIVIVVVLVK